MNCAVSRGHLPAFPMVAGAAVALLAVRYTPFTGLARVCSLASLAFGVTFSGASGFGCWWEASVARQAEDSWAHLRCDNLSGACRPANAACNASLALLTTPSWTPLAASLRALRPFGQLNITGIGTAECEVLSSLQRLTPRLRIPWLLTPAVVASKRALLDSIRWCVDGACHKPDLAFFRTRLRPLFLKALDTRGLRVLRLYVHGGSIGRNVALRLLDVLWAYSAENISDVTQKGSVCWRWPKYSSDMTQWEYPRQGCPQSGLNIASRSGARRWQSFNRTVVVRQNVTAVVTFTWAPGTDCGFRAKNFNLKRACVLRNRELRRLTNATDTSWQARLWNMTRVDGGSVAYPFHWRYLEDSLRQGCPRLEDLWQAHNLRHGRHERPDEQTAWLVPTQHIQHTCRQVVESVFRLAGQRPSHRYLILNQDGVHRLPLNHALMEMFSTAATAALGSNSSFTTAPSVQIIPFGLGDLPILVNRPSQTDTSQSSPELARMLMEFAITNDGVHAREPYVHMVATQILLAILADQSNEKPSSVWAGLAQQFKTSAPSR